MTALTTAILTLLTLWGACALWYQAAPSHPLRVLAVVSWGLVCLTLIVAVWSHRTLAGLTGFALAFSVLLVWWHGVKPSNDRIWADDVARVASGEMADTKVV